MLIRDRVDEVNEEINEVVPERQITIQRSANSVKEKSNLNSEKTPATTYPTTYVPSLSNVSDPDSGENVESEIPALYSNRNLMIICGPNGVNYEIFSQTVNSQLKRYLNRKNGLISMF